MAIEVEARPVLTDDTKEHICALVRAELAAELDRLRKARSSLLSTTGTFAVDEAR
jgi:hypothetical protein